MIALTSTRRVTLLAFAVLVLVTTIVGCFSENAASEDSASESFTAQNDAPEPDTDAPVVVAAGDIADCASGGDEATARLLGGIPGTILTLGDNAYEAGSREEYVGCYGPTWGRFKYRTRPAPGNHEYDTPGAAGYFGYFGGTAGNPGEGYYSYDLGSWHMIALNSNCGEVGGCSAGDPQQRWLKADLADNRRRCTLAYFHHPLFSSGKYSPGIPKVKPLWETLYAAGADVVLNGHDHNYQRFAPQDPEGKADPERGIRQFVVGTGGRRPYLTGPPIGNSQVQSDDAFGVLKLTLRPEGYDWWFVPVEGAWFTDSGSARCY